MRPHPASSRETEAVPRRVLVVDDEPKIVDVVRDYLTDAGFSVATAADGPTALSRARAQPPDLVVLDLGLPGMDGLDVARELQRRSAVPIIMLTARSDEVDRVLGLELGADDYLAKPFNPRELLARIRAVLRRAAAGPAESAPRFESGSLAIDFAAREVTVAGKRVVPTHFEFELLALLARSAGRVLSRDQIVDRLKGEEWGSYDRSIDVHVSKLRSKIEDDPKQPRWIKTVRGVGYVLSRPDAGGG